MERKEKPEELPEEETTTKIKKKKKKKIDPFVPKTDHHNPRELRSWAKRTGFVPKSLFSSGETASAGERNDGGIIASGGGGGGGLDLEKGFSGLRGTRGGSSPKIEIDPVLGQTRAGGGGGGGGPEIEAEAKREERVDDGLNGNGHVRDREDGKGEVSGDGNGEEQQGREAVGNGGGDGDWRGQSGIKCGLRDNPGLAPLMCYGLQHLLSMAGSLIFIPLIMVPAMGGTDKDTATVISTMLLVSGVTTLLNSYFGTRLPLVQGSSFVYLAPALVIMNSNEHRNLTDHKFRRIMREIQGAIIVGSIFQSFLGFSGLMSLLLRVINPIVVAPTVAAVGLAFFSYGFPQAGNCVEISLPLILLVLIFTLYLRGISVFGHRLFWIYAVPLSVSIIWTYAFFLTAGGAYDYRGCSVNVPSSNILNDACRKHAFTMQHCRTDASNAWKSAAWVRIPYPLQWGIPVFHLRTSLIMIVASLVATVDSVGTYHTTSVLINVKPPTPGIVSRGIALEGFCSILAGLWGSGTGSTTLTENMHTIKVTKIASRRAVELGAVFLIFFSFIGKVGAILASIPLALAAATLCFIWALIVALGLSTLQYSQMASYRNITIVGISFFLGLSIPTYVQQYQPESSLILPSYFVPYAAASNGPVRSGNEQIDFALNSLLSLSMVVTLLVAFVLDNTAPGSRQERGVYIWSKAEEIRNDPSSLADYSLPGKICRCLCLPKCLGV